MNRSSLLAICFLVCTGLALDCDWDQSIDPEQTLVYGDSAMLHLDKITKVSDPESCRAACCDQWDCDLAMVVDSANGSLHCLRVNCMIQDRDVCVLKPSTGSRLYRKKGERQVKGDAEEPHVVPLMVSWEPRTNETKVSQDAEPPVKSEPAATESSPVQEKEMSAADFAERCGAEPEVGPCRAAFQHWYYNSETGDCQSFIYGGCRGNKNNYISKESCMATCAVRVLPSSKKVAAEDDVSTEYKDDCMATSDPGPCRAAFPMFYYDPNTATCQSFIYGGCRGNQNRYGTVDECMSHCSRDGSFDTRGKARDRWTAAVFLFVTLAAISALLLATLVIITVRRRSLSCRPSSISDKEELLPEPDEQSSLESLTIPESPKPDKA